MIVKKKEKKDNKILTRKGAKMRGDDSKKSKRIRHPNKF
jgi:hypothetical protein